MDSGACVKIDYCATNQSTCPTTAGSICKASFFDMFAPKTVCGCESGFEEQYDNNGDFTGCQAINDPCIGNPCSDYCSKDENDPNNYICSCQADFILDADNSTCIENPAIPQPANLINEDGLFAMMNGIFCVMRAKRFNTKTQRWYNTKVTPGSRNWLNIVPCEILNTTRTDINADALLTYQEHLWQYDVATRQIKSQLRDIYDNPQCIKAKLPKAPLSKYHATSYTNSLYLADCDDSDPLQVWENDSGMWVNTSVERKLCINFNPLYHKNQKRTYLQYQATGKVKKWFGVLRYRFCPNLSNVLQ